MLGFKGSDWHTHGDLLVPEHGQSPRAAAMSFFDLIVNDAQPIFVRHSTGQAWLVSYPEHELAPHHASQTVSVRLWSGKGVGHADGP